MVMRNHGVHIISSKMDLWCFPIMLCFLESPYLLVINFHRNKNVLHEKSPLTH